MVTNQTSDPSRTVPTRRISFGADFADLPRHFAKDGDLVGSHIIAALSGVFPDGEDFFVRSVRYYRDEISDPVLKQQVNGFIGQESTHGREHRGLNVRLDELGYNTHKVERFTRFGLGLRSRHTSPISCLAATAALEHFTAVLAEKVLHDEEFRDMIGHEGVRNLFVWHALEESEHKAVAFDVYRAVGGSERMRVLIMKITRVGFVGGTIAQVALGLLGDRATFKRGRLRQSLRYLKDSPLIDREMWKALKEYDRRGFHPDDRDTTELVAEWRERLFGDEGALNANLTTSVA